MTGGRILHQGIGTKIHQPVLGMGLQAGFKRCGTIGSGIPFQGIRHVVAVRIHGHVAGQIRIGAHHAFVIVADAVVINIQIIDVRDTITIQIGVRERLLATVTIIHQGGVIMTGIHCRARMQLHNAGIEGAFKYRERTNVHWALAVDKSIQSGVGPQIEAAVNVHKQLVCGRGLVDIHFIRQSGIVVHHQAHGAFTQNFDVGTIIHDQVIDPVITGRQFDGGAELKVQGIDQVFRLGTVEGQIAGAVDHHIAELGLHAIGGGRLQDAYVDVGGCSA